MKRCGAILLAFLANPFLGSSFSANPGLASQSAKRRVSTSTSLGATIRFVGNASARLNTPSIVVDDQAGDKSLPEFFTTSESDVILLGTRETRLLEGGSGGDGELWECRQANVDWFGMQLTPIFTNRIEKNLSRGNVVSSIIDARTDVQQGGRLGNTLASAMKRSVFEGRNVVSWSERGDVSGDDALGYTLEGDLKLTLTINLPPLLPLPPGFNAIGSKIVERTCRQRLQQNLNDISDAYLVWATTPQK